MTNNPQSKNRIHFLDEMRGLAVFCMVFYHAFYVIGEFFGAEWAESLFCFFLPVQPLFAGIFIFLCGISCTLSKSNVKRGANLLGIALGMTLVTAVVMPKMGFYNCEIYFGILHFLSLSILISALLSKPISKASPFIGILLCAVLYAFSSGIDKGVLNYGELISITLPESLYESNLLMPIGIYAPGFFSADYFPLFPDIFIFFSGVFAGRYFLKNGWPETFYQKRASFLSWLGRKALMIYIVHMPAVYALAYAIDFVIKN